MATRTFTITQSGATRTFTVSSGVGPAGSGGGGDALVADPLSQFAATTSAQLAGVLTDETGTGSAVFATSPTLTSPVLNTGVSGTAILDEDDLASDSDTQLATQQSIKAYVDDAIKAVTITAKVNEAGGITKGQVVFISGATGGFPQVSLADNTDFAKSDVLAVATETKTNGQNVAITIAGLVANIDTSAYTEGAVLYLGTSGNITETHPTGIYAVERIGHAVKINASTGSILVELDGLTVINDHDGIMRHQIVNQNAGTSASAAYTIVNDAAYRSSLSMVGSNYAVVAGISNSLIIYNEGYNKTVNAVDGNYGFEWWTDETDSHNLTSTSKMSLTADGELHTLCQTIDHTATEADDHALEIDCDAAGFGDVKAIDVAYDTGAITTGQDESIILVNIDESAATGGDVTALEVLATEGSANINGMLTGVGVNPIEQLSGVFVDMDSALVNATDRLTDFTTAGSDVQMFVADDDTVTIGSSAKFEEIEFLLAITANLSIRPDFEFSTGSGTWTTFTPVDGTNGMRNTGVIAWLDGDIPTWAVGTGSEYLIRITRQRNTLSTPPTESKVQIAAATEYKWDKDGDLIVNTVTATGNVDSANTGANAPVSTAQEAAIEAEAQALNVKTQYGATGDGVTDDTAAIQAAITAALAADRSVFIPAGDYKLTDELDVPSGSIILGESWVGTTLTQTGTNKHVFHMTSDGPRYGFTHIEDLWLVGPGMGATTGYGLFGDGDPNGLNNCTFRKIRSTGFNKGGYFDTVDNSVFEQCNWGNSGNTNNVGLHITGNSNAVSIISNTCFSTTLGLQISSGNAIGIRGFEMGGGGQTGEILIDGAAQVAIRDFNAEWWPVGDSVDNIAIDARHAQASVVIENAHIRYGATGVSGYSLALSTGQVVLKNCSLSATYSEGGKDSAIRQTSSINSLLVAENCSSVCVNIYNTGGTFKARTRVGLFPAEPEASGLSASENHRGRFIFRTLLDSVSSDDTLSIAIRIAAGTYAWVNLLDYYVDKLAGGGGSPAFLTAQNTFTGQRQTLQHSGYPAWAIRTGADAGGASRAVFGITTANNFGLTGANAGDTYISAKSGGDLVFGSNTGTTGQTSRFRIKDDGVLSFDTQPTTYADDSAATTGGLVTGDIYKTSTGQLMVVL